MRFVKSALIGSMFQKPNNIIVLSYLRFEFTGLTKDFKQIYKKGFICVAIAI